MNLSIYGIFFGNAFYHVIIASCLTMTNDNNLFNWTWTQVVQASSLDSRLWSGVGIDSGIRPSASLSYIFGIDHLCWISSRTDRSRKPLMIGFRTSIENSNGSVKYARSSTTGPASVVDEGAIVPRYPGAQPVQRTLEDVRDQVSQEIAVHTITKAKTHDGEAKSLLFTHVIYSNLHQYKILFDSKRRSHRC